MNSHMKLYIDRSNSTLFMTSPSSSRPSPLLPRSPLFFTTIPEEMDKEDEEEEEVEVEEKKQAPSPPPKKKRGDNHQLSVLCNNCRASKSRDSSKSTSVVPLDRSYLTSTPPSKLLHSLLLRIKSPSPSTSAPSEVDPTDWKLAAHELSRKLLQATRRRDDALLEASRLKHTVSDLDLKLAQLESYCLDLKKTLDEAGPTADNFEFPAAVAEARTAVRILTRSLSIQIRPTRIASMLKLPIPNTATLLIYIESLLNKVFYNGFDNLTEGPHILDPKSRCEMNRASYEKVKALTWEEVLCKGSKYYSEGLSKFCDKKMGEIVGLLGWSRCWSESLLQAFFGAAKGVWLVGLLGRCVYPAVTVMNVERGVGFDGRFMENVVGGKDTAVSVTVMLAPGFYLYDNKGGFQVVCTVVCGL